MTDASRPSDAPPAADILGAPPADLLRSPASRRVGDLAQRSGLLMAHYEHRHRLDLPEHWEPLDRPDLDAGGRPAWRGGMLPELKYGGFRHDRLVGSFHPGHGAGWTAHELCHGLVGFAWRPDASPLFHALAARLAEVLPVALWYFLDLAAGPSEADPDAAADAAWIGRGEAFVAHELAAVARSARRGAPEPHRLGSLDLSSDSLAYAASHGPRLASREFARFIELFFAGPEHGLHATLEELAARTAELLAAVTGSGTAAPLQGSAARWMAQDIGWRLLTVHAETAGEAAAGLDALAAGLAGDVTDRGISEAITGYEALFEDFDLPPAEQVFAVGYPLPGGRFGVDRDQLADGIRSACPRALDLLGAAAAAEVDAFIDGDARPETWERVPVGRRFAGFLARGSAGLAADMAALESALVHAPPADAAAEALGAQGGRDARVRLRPGVQLLELAYDVIDDTLERLAAPQQLAVWRAASGEVQLAELTTDAYRALDLLTDGHAHQASSLRILHQDLEGLRASGLIVPAAWTTD